MKELFLDQNGRLSSALVIRWIFTLLLFGLCLGYAHKEGFNLELLIFVASVAGFEGLTYTFRRGQDRRVERAFAEQAPPVPRLAHAVARLPLRRGQLGEVGAAEDDAEGEFDEGDDEDDLVERDVPSSVHLRAEAEAARSGTFKGLRDLDPGHIGLAALYAHNAGGSDPRFINRNFQGEPCPAWEDLPQNVREKWAAVGKLARGLACGETWAENAVWGLSWHEPSDVEPPKAVRAGHFDGLDLFINGRTATAEERAELEAKADRWELEAKQAAALAKATP